MSKTTKRSPSIAPLRVVAHAEPNTITKLTQLGRTIAEQIWIEEGGDLEEGAAVCPTPELALWAKLCHDLGLIAGERFTAAEAAAITSGYREQLKENYLSVIGASFMRELEKRGAEWAAADEDVGSSALPAVQVS